MFAWASLKERRFRRLIGFCLLSLFGHALVFYLVQVVTLPSQRTLPHQAEITLLHPDNPVAAALLTRFDDRAAAFWGATQSLASGMVQIEDYSVVYRPSFSGFEPALKPWTRASREVEVAPLGLAGDLSLPPVAVVPPPTVEPAPAARPRGVTVVARGELADRALVGIPDVDPSGWSGAGSGRVSLLVGVGAAGRVEAQVPLEVGLPDVASIARFAQALRFAPDRAGHEPLVWGTVEISW